MNTRTAEFNAALLQASAELGLQNYYVDCVRPLFATPLAHWPTCCGGGCEPCAQTLIAVAQRVCELLGIDEQTLQRA